MARWPLEKDTTKLYIIRCKEEGIEYLTTAKLLGCKAVANA